MRTVWPSQAPAITPCEVPASSVAQAGPCPRPVMKWVHSHSRRVGARNHNADTHVDLLHVHVRVRLVNVCVTNVHGGAKQAWDRSGNIQTQHSHPGLHPGRGHAPMALAAAALEARPFTGRLNPACTHGSWTPTWCPRPGAYGWHVCTAVQKAVAHVQCAVTEQCARPAISGRTAQGHSRMTVPCVNLKMASVKAVSQDN